MLSDIDLIIQRNLADEELASQLRDIWDIIVDISDDMYDKFIQFTQENALPPNSIPAEKCEVIRSTIDKYMVALYNRHNNPEWIDILRRNTQLDLIAVGVTAEKIFERREVINEIILDRISKVYYDQPYKFLTAMKAIMKLWSREMELMQMTMQITAKEQSQKQETARTQLFDRQIALTAEKVSKATKIIQSQSSTTEDVANGLLQSSSEVATAAEQSAIAMREAAQTAAGLIRAIEGARSEVDIASDVANRAADNADEAVIATDTLVEQSKSIASILDLIRDIAGQTNLLALNATIEAARAGEAGRGFAVVAHEVKSLASQTASATDEIARKINAIQTATQASLESNGMIKTTVEDMQKSAERIRIAMEEQANTVTVITASVDETALSADSMSSTISVIKSDTESFVTEISELKHSVNDMNEQIEKLQSNTKDFRDHSAPSSSAAA